MLSKQVINQYMSIKKFLNGPIARSTIQTSFVLGLRLLVQAGTLLLVARMLGPEQFGAFAGIAALAVLLGTFSTFGTHLVLLGEMSKDATQRDAVLSYAVPTTLVCGTLLFALYLAICELLFSNISLPISALVCIGITETILLPLFLLPAIELLAVGKTARSQFITISPLALRMLAAVGVIVSAPETPLLVFAWFYIATALLALVIMKWYKASVWLTVKQWRIASKEQLKHSAGFAALAMTAAGPSEVDKMLAVKLLPVGVSGVYVAASRVVGAATLPVIALLLSAMPRLFRDNEEEVEQSKQLTLWIFAAIFIYSVCLATLLWLCAPILEWLFGTQYDGLADMLAWLCFAVPALALRYATGSILITMNKPWLRARFEVIGVIVLVVTSGLLISQMGVYAMPVALACSEWLMVIVGGVMIIKLKSK